jgi:flagellin
MASTINTNINSLTAQRNLAGSQASLSTSMQRLSSGLRINSAKDDAAGLGISERMTSQIRGLNQAARNANDGISFAQTAEGALASSGSLIQRIRELAVQSANGTNSAADRKSIQAEAGQLLQELDRIATTTQFNGQTLLDGSVGSATFQVGANANQTIVATGSNFRNSTYGAQLADSALVEASDTAADIQIDGTLQIAGLETADITLDTTDTAKTAAAKVNAVSEKTGVSASAQTKALVEFATADSSYSFEFQNADGDAVATISFAVGAVDTSAGLAEAVKAFNEAASSTGFSARMNDDATGIVLTNIAGENLYLKNTGTEDVDLSAYDAATTTTDGVESFGTAKTLGTDDVGYSVGSLEFSSEKGFTIGADTDSDIADPDTASTLNAVDSIDLSSVDGATKALKIADAALATISSQRAAFGALQSRFENTVSNLQISSENLSASRSRIQDADFATETANLSRAQILQQAGTAMVAQANQLPQGVLALLR